MEKGPLSPAIQQEALPPEHRPLTSSISNIQERVRNAEAQA